MTQQHTDDVTGELIGGDTERWWRLGGLDLLPPQDIADVDTLLQVVRDHLTAKSPTPLDIYTIQRLPGDKPPALARYAPADEEPAAEAPADDAPFGPLRAFKLPTFGASQYRFIPAVPPADLDALKARADKARTKYVRACAALCGCNDFDAHSERIIG